jgi:hypothetical protein
MIPTVMRAEIDKRIERAQAEHGVGVLLDAVARRLNERQGKRLTLKHQPNVFSNVLHRPAEIAIESGFCS